MFTVLFFFLNVLYLTKRSNYKNYILEIIILFNMIDDDEKIKGHPKLIKIRTIIIRSNIKRSELTINTGYGTEVLKNQ